MNVETFDKLVDYVVTERIKGVMCRKSAEYARGKNKLHNFYRAAEVSGKTPLECLQGMKLKHDVSILDMLDDEAKGTAHYSREQWEEKIGDAVNYFILMLGLLYDRHDWQIPDVETTPGYAGAERIRKDCCICLHRLTPVNKEPCCSCGLGHHMWEVESGLGHRMWEVEK